jgi:hypothetical protein
MGEVVTVAKPKRPLAVWITTAINTVLAIILLASSFRGGDWDLPALQVAFWAVLGLAIWISALSTWWGSRNGRNVMLVLVTVYLGLVLVQTVQTIKWMQDWSMNESYMLRYLLRIVLVFAWLVANYWLLLGKRTRAYFA